MITPKCTTIAAGTGKATRPRKRINCAAEAKVNPWPVKILIHRIFYGFYSLIEILQLFDFFDIFSLSLNQEPYVLSGARWEGDIIMVPEQMSPEGVILRVRHLC